MSYDNPNRMVYIFPLLDFGDGGIVHYISGPKGKKGRLIDYGVQSLSEIGVGSSTAPSVAIGNSDDADAYGEELSLLLASSATQGLTVRSLYDEIADATSFDALMVDPQLPADTAIYVTCTQGNGGTPAGKGHPFVVIDWDK